MCVRDQAVSNILIPLKIFAPPIPLLFFIISFMLPSHADRLLPSLQQDATRRKRPCYSLNESIRKRLFLHGYKFL